MSTGRALSAPKDDRDLINADFLHLFFDLHRDCGQWTTQPAIRNGHEFVQVICPTCGMDCLTSAPILAHVRADLDAEASR